MEYQCTLVRGKRKERWLGEIRLISTEFILKMNGLDQGIGISTLLQIVKSIQMHTVETFCRMTLGYKVLRSRKGRLTEKSKGGAIRSEETITRWFFRGQNRGVKMLENRFQCFRFQLCPLLVEGGSRWGI